MVREGIVLRYLVSERAIEYIVSLVMLVFIAAS
jgi:hypothetical protein